MSASSLDAHIDRVDGGPPKARFRPQPARGSKVGSPLEEITLHAVGEPTHWHLVTRGLTELEAKESPNANLSGWGFELTLRLERADRRQNGPVPGGSDPGHDADDIPPDAPEWAVDLLTNLAAYVWTSGHAFAAGHHLDLGGPIKLPGKKDRHGPSTAITAAAIVRDPTLGRLRTPYGRVEFLQVVGLTTDELELCRAWSTDGVLRLLAADDPMLVTRLNRRSLLADPIRAAEIARLASVDGSSLTELRVASLRWNPRRVGGSILSLGAGASRALGPALRRELIGPGAGFSVISDSVVARFTVADEAAWSAEGERIVISVPLGEVEGLAALFDGRTGQGRRPAWPELRFRVVS